MIFPPVFELASYSVAVRAHLGSDPIRLYAFGRAPQAKAYPYAVWQVVGGQPENFLGTLPDADRYVVQIDIYASSITEARTIAEALRDALQESAYVVAWRGESVDQETQKFRFGFDVEFITRRA